jgi:two-component system cell cycle response regulator DivK
MSLPSGDSGPTVLLVDDFDDTRQMYGHYLRHFGYEPIEAATGEDALTLALARQPAVILMDLQLPGMDGWEITRRLKKDDRTRHIPVIALTAHALDRDRERTRLAGCDAFLSKPCSPDQLLKAIGRLLVPRPASAKR